MSAVITSDDTLVIETPERVPLHFALASIGNRFIACAIDHTIQIVALITLGIIFAIITDAPDIGSRLMNAPKWVIALLVIIQFLIFDGYFAVFEWVWRGQTPGKRWLKLRVIREDGRPISFFEAMIRNLLRVVDIIFPPFYSIGLISVFATNRDQRVGDLVARDQGRKAGAAHAALCVHAPCRRGWHPSAALTGPRRAQGDTCGRKCRNPRRPP